MDRLIRFAAAGFVLVVIAGLLASPWPLGSRLPWAGMTLASALIAAGGVLFGTSVANATAGRDPLLLPIVAFLAWCLLAAIAGWSAYPHATRTEAFQFLAWGLVLLLLRQVLGPRSTRLIVATVLLVAAAVFAFGLQQHATWNGKMFWSYDPPYGGTAPFASFNNRNHFAGYAVAALGPALGLALAGRGGWRLAGLLTAVSGLVAVLLSLSRGGFLAMAVATVVVVTMTFRSRHAASRRSWHLWHAVAAAGALLVLAAGSLGALHALGMTDAVKQRLATLLSPSAETSATGRLQIWGDTLPMIADRPIVGHGLNTFAWAHLRFRTTGDDSLPQHAHNEYLEMTAETGLVGAAICVWFLVLLLREFAMRMGTARPGFERGLRIGCLASWAGMLTLALTDFPTVIPATNLVLAVTAALGSAGWNDDQGS